MEAAVVIYALLSAGIILMGIKMILEPVKMMLYYTRKFRRYYYRCTKCGETTGFNAERKRIQKNADEKTG